MKLYTSKVPLSAAFSMIETMSAEFVKQRSKEDDGKNDFLMNSIYLRVKNKCSANPSAQIFPKTIKNRTMLELYNKFHEHSKREHNDYHFKTNAKVILELYKKADQYLQNSKSAFKQERYRDMTNAFGKFGFFYNKLVHHVFLRKFEQKHNVLLSMQSDKVEIIDCKNGHVVKGKKQEKLSQELDTIMKKIKRFRITNT